MSDEKYVGDRGLEIMARAICTERGSNPDGDYAINNFYDDGRPEPDVAVPAWRCYRPAARAAIQALIEAGFTVTPPPATPA